MKVEAIIGKNEEAIMNFEKVMQLEFIMLMNSSFLPNLLFVFTELILVIWWSQARSIDPYIVTYMDEYAMLLKIKSDYAKLSKLVHDLLNIDPARPEVFVALSVLWERRGEKRALSYAEQVSSFILCRMDWIILSVGELLTIDWLFL